MISCFGMALIDAAQPRTRAAVGHGRCSSSRGKSGATYPLQAECAGAPTRTTWSSNHGLLSAATPRAQLHLESAKGTLGICRAGCRMVGLQLGRHLTNNSLRCRVNTALQQHSQHPSTAYSCFSPQDTQWHTAACYNLASSATTTKFASHHLCSDCLLQPSRLGISGIANIVDNRQHSSAHRTSEQSPAASLEFSVSVHLRQLLKRSLALFGVQLRIQTARYRQQPAGLAGRVTGCSSIPTRPRRGHGHDACR